MFHCTLARNYIVFNLVDKDLTTSMEAFVDAGEDRA